MFFFVKFVENFRAGAENLRAHAENFWADAENFLTTCLCFGQSSPPHGAYIFNISLWIIDPAVTLP